MLVTTLDNLSENLSGSALRGNFHLFEMQQPWMLHSNDANVILQGATRKIMPPSVILIWSHSQGIPKATAQSFQSIRKLKFKLEDNSWEEPPWEVVKGGWQQIISYSEALERSGSTKTYKLKVVLLGAVRAGKTTLVRGLRKGKAAPTKDGERTRGVDVLIQPWRPNPAQPLEVVIWDFAGHADYYSTHQVEEVLWSY